MLIKWKAMTAKGRNTTRAGTGRATGQIAVATSQTAAAAAMAAV